MTLTNQQIAMVRKVANMTTPYITTCNGEVIGVEANEVEHESEIIYFVREAWLRMLMPEVRKETGIVEFVKDKVKHN